MGEFTFNSESHEYFLGKRKLPGVTDIIKDNGLMTGSNFYTELGRLKGTMVHKACELLSHNNLDWSTVDQQIFGYVVSYAEYLAHSNFQPRRTEYKAFHSQLVYAGTWDADGSSLDCPDFIFDLKSGAREKWHGYQTAAYQELAKANGITVKRRGTIYLQSDGSMAKLYLHDDRNDFKIFISALNLTKARG